MKRTRVACVSLSLLILLSACAATRPAEEVAYLKAAQDAVDQANAAADLYSGALNRTGGCESSPSTCLDKALADYAAAADALQALKAPARLAQVDAHLKQFAAHVRRFLTYAPIAVGGSPNALSMAQGELSKAGDELTTASALAQQLQ